MVIQNASGTVIPPGCVRLSLITVEVLGVTATEKLTTEIRALPDVEKLRLLDAILVDLDRPDPELDMVWAEEARKRWAAYAAGRMPTVSYQEVMEKHRR